MKIYHILSNRTWGGGEVYALTLAKEQVKNGHDVEIICANRPPVVDRFKAEGFKVHVMQLHGHINFLAPWKFANMIRKSSEETVIHVHRIPDTVFACKAINHLSKKEKPALVMTHHLIELPLPDKRYHKPYSKIDRIICVSQKSKDTLLSVPTNIDPKKVTVILNSTKVKTENRENVAAKNKSVNITYIGRIVEEKGVDTIISALPYIKGAKLTICGGGPGEYVDKLHSLAKDLKVEDRINWVGFTTEVSKYIAKADIGVIPSRWEEPCALVNFEFLAAGVPLVTSNTGGQPEIITDGEDGLLVSPDDPKALADALQRLIDNPELRIKMGEAARKTFEDRFTYDKFYKKVMDVYSEALDSKN